MTTHEKAMSAAREAWTASDVSTRFFSDVEHCALEAAIRSYLSSAIPGEVAELVERLNKRADTMNGALVGASDGATYTLGYYDQFAAADDRSAATALTSLAARVEALEAGLEPFAEAANDADRLAGHDGPLGQYVELSHLRAARLLRKKDRKA